MSADLKTVRIELTQGRFALVSSEDFDHLKSFKWQAVKCNGRFYARRSAKRDQGRCTSVVYMHQQVLGDQVPKGYVIDHINGDGLDNRRPNLRVATVAQNNMNIQATRCKTGVRGVYLHRGKYMVRIARKYAGIFDNLPEAAHRANLLLEQLSPGVGIRNEVDVRALMQTLTGRRAAIDQVLQQLMEVDHAG